MRLIICKYRTMVHRHNHDGFGEVISTNSGIEDCELRFVMADANPANLQRAEFECGYYAGNSSSEHYQFLSVEDGGPVHQIITPPRGRI